MRAAVANVEAATEDVAQSTLAAVLKEVVDEESANVVAEAREEAPDIRQRQTLADAAMASLLAEEDAAPDAAPTKKKKKKKKRKTRKKKQTAPQPPTAVPVAAAVQTAVAVPRGRTRRRPARMRLRTTSAPPRINYYTPPPPPPPRQTRRVPRTRSFGDLDPSDKTYREFGWEDENRAAAQNEPGRRRLKSFS